MRINRQVEGKTTSFIRGSTPEINNRAKWMRRNLTPAEEALWDAIKRVYFDGVRFRRQHPVGTWILDFYCPKLKLVIEVDGKIHDSKTEYDAIRTAHLESHGYHVVRFQNEEIFGDLPGVMIKIQIAVEQLAQK